MSELKHFRPERTWGEKFRDAASGLVYGVRGQSSFFAHLFVTAVVVVAGAMLHLNHEDWCLLALCIFGVLSAEMFNSALESMARAITDESDPHVGAALDIGSAAVLLASVGASIVGAIVFLRRLDAMGWHW